MLHLIYIVWSYMLQQHSLATKLATCYARSYKLCVSCFHWLLQKYHCEYGPIDFSRTIHTLEPNMRPMKSKRKNTSNETINQEHKLGPWISMKKWGDSHKKGGCCSLTIKEILPSPNNCWNLLCRFWTCQQIGSYCPWQHQIKLYINISIPRIGGNQSLCFGKPSIRPLYISSYE